MRPDAEEPTNASAERNELLLAVLRDHAPTLLPIFRKRCGQEYEDAFHDFVVTVLINRGLLAKLDALDGAQRLVSQRSLVRKAANDFCRDRYRRSTARKNAERRRTDGSPAHTGTSRDGTSSPDADHNRHPEVPTLDTLASEWARGVLADAIHQTCRYFHERDAADHWTAYYERVMAPAALGGTPTPIEQLCDRTHFTSREEVYDAVAYVKRRLLVTLTTLIEEEFEYPPSAQEALSFFHHAIEQ